MKVRIKRIEAKIAAEQIRANLKEFKTMKEVLNIHPLLNEFERVTNGTNDLINELDRKLRADKGNIVIKEEGEHYTAAAAIKRIEEINVIFNDEVEVEVKRKLKMSEVENYPMLIAEAVHILLDKFVE